MDGRSQTAPQPARAREAAALLAERERLRRGLHEAVTQVEAASLASSLQRIADKLPEAISVETASIRLRASDGDRDLHLLAASGVATADVRRLAFTPISLAHARTLFALGPRHSQARELGLRWVVGEWIIGPEGLAGCISVGTRTERRPSGDDLERLAVVAEQLGERLGRVDRRTRMLRLAAVEVAREAARSGAPLTPDDATAVLRPRERLILDLYANGLGTAAIADVLVISPHTVRTHTKLAMRRLGVHSRDEAAKIVAARRVLAIV
ncbi:MAG TPA: LuxR C-terminal-related transcriptional regulator [Gaiellaceae bacterium]|nr:LuxR C-terminal-related transcriptional regulator [Gaiellaceae bacterium]